MFHEYKYAVSKCVLPKAFTAKEYILSRICVWGSFSESKCICMNLKYACRRRCPCFKRKRKLSSASTSELLRLLLEGMRLVAMEVKDHLLVKIAYLN